MTNEERIKFLEFEVLDLKHELSDLKTEYTDSSRRLDIQEDKIARNIKQLGDALLNVFEAFTYNDEHYIINFKTLNQIKEKLDDIRNPTHNLNYSYDNRNQHIYSNYGNGAADTQIKFPINRQLEEWQTPSDYDFGVVSELKIDNAETLEDIKKLLHILFETQFNLNTKKIYIKEEIVEKHNAYSVIKTKVQPKDTVSHVAKLRIKGAEVDI